MKQLIFCVAWLMMAPCAPAAAPPDEAPRQLLEIRRVHVEKMTGEAASHVRNMIINSLQRGNLFAITDDPDRADAVLRGSAEDLIYTDTHQYSDGIQARVGFGRGGYQGTARNNDRRSGSAAVGEQESSRTQERRHESTAAVRLVNKAGDVIWSTTKESTGAKFRSAAADVADKIMRQLLDDYERAKRLSAPGQSAPASASTLPRPAPPPGSPER